MGVQHGPEGRRVRLGRRTHTLETDDLGQKVNRALESIHLGGGKGGGYKGLGTRRRP